MGERHIVGKPGASPRERLAHVSEQKELSRRNAVRMGCNGALADINFAAGEQVSKVIVGPTVAEAEFKHITIHTCDQFGGQFEASALCFESADEAV